MATQSSSNPTGDQKPISNAEPAAAKPTVSPTTAEQPVASNSSSTAAEQPTVTPEATTTAKPTSAEAAPPEAVAAESIAPAQPTVVFVTAPQPPKKRGARGVGALVALLGTGVFAAAYALFVLVLALVGARGGLTLAVQFLSSVSFYVPVIVFFFAYLLLIVIVNRAGWWAHVLGGFAIAVIVWVGFVGAAILAAGAFGGSSAEVGAVVVQQLTNPLGFAAAIAAREVPIWVGGLVSKRGRTVRARNVAATAAYQHELAEHRATLGANTAV